MSMPPTATLEPRHILVLADLTLGAKSAVWRAGLLAREHGATVQVLHVLREARHALLARTALDTLCAGVRERLGIPVEVEVRKGDPVREAVRAARDAGLLVLASRAGNTLRERIAGAPVERVLRLCRVPALVVKRPAAPPRDALRGGDLPPGRYGRVLVPVDLGREAAAVIAAAARFSLDPCMEVFHAVAAGKDRRVPAGDGAAPTGGTAVERARAGLQDLVAAAGADGRGIAVGVGFGRAASSVLGRERAIGAELLVVGKRQRGLFADWFLGGLTQQILAGSRADVLVVPAAAAHGVPPLGAQGGTVRPP